MHCCLFHKHYVANVLADLRSAGMEYQDLRFDYFLFCIVMLF